MTAEKLIKINTSQPNQIKKILPQSLKNVIFIPQNLQINLAFLF